MTYTKRINAMTTINPTSGNASGLAKTLSNLQVDAVFLHASLQGIDILYDLTDRTVSPASNAITALLKSVMDQAQHLADELDRVST
jgi:hypothetical protein